MKMRILILIAAIAAITLSAFGAVSPDKAAWAKGPVQFLMTPEEQAAWKAIDTDAKAADFIELFWARRDPTPNTAKNEYQEDFQLRVEAADKNFTTTRTKGSLSDRGKVLILFGMPSKITRSAEPPSNNIQTPGSRPEPRGTSATEAVDTSNWPAQIWTWEGDKAEKIFGAPHVELRFIDRMNQGEFKLETPLIDFRAASGRAIAAMITNPDLKVPPSKQPPPPAAAVPAPEGITTAAFQEAVNAAKSAKPSPNAVIGYAEFVDPTGEYFVPMALTVPKSAGIEKDSVQTFFGEIDDANGAKVAAFEQPAKLVSSNGMFFADKTFALPSGKYTAVLGLAGAGKPLIVTTAPVELHSIAKDAVGTSKLILWNDVQTLLAAAPVRTGFAWGKLQLVPKFDGAFTAKDDLGYFVEVNNPGIDPASNMPKLQMGIELQQNGKTMSQLPLMEAEALTLSGQPGPGHYALMNSIPLSQMKTPLKPGDYTMKMKILDTVTKQSYTVTQTFKITG